VKAEDSRPSEILLVEDNPGDMDLIRAYLEEGPGEEFHLESVGRLSDACERLSRGAIDIVLLDLGLPDASGFEALQVLHSRFEALPVVVLTGQQDDEVGLSAMQLGAEDFLSKGSLSAALLVRSLRYALQRKDMSSKALANERRFSHFFDHMLDGIAVFDVIQTGEGSEQASTRFVKANPSFYRCFGGTEARARGRTFDELLPEIAKDALPRLPGLMRSADAVRFESNCDGAGRDFEIEAFRSAPTQFTVVFREVTEERKSAKELKAQRDLLLQVERDAKIGRWTFDASTGEAHWSDELHRMFGLPLDEPPPVFAEHGKLFAPGAMEKLEPLVSRALLTGDPYHLRLELNPERGGAEWIETHGFPRRSEDGKITGLYGFARDVTEEQRAERQLKLLAAVAANTDNLVIITDAERRCLWINEACERVSGYSLDEMIGKNPGRLLQCEETDPATVEMIRTQLNQGKRVSAELLNRAKDGSDYWIQLGIEPLFDEEGNVTNFVGVSTDVTERIQREESLRRHATFLETTEEIASIGGWEIDLENNLPIWTEQTRRIHEAPEGFQPTMQTALEFFPPKSREKLEAVIQEAISTGAPYDIELPMTTARERTIIVRIKGFAESRNGKVVRLFGAIRNVTEQKRVEQELLKSRDRAEAASKAKSQFLANMSHEIRTPLNAILGMSELLRSKPPSDEADECIETIHASGKALLALVSDILDFSKIEAGKIELEEASLRLESFVEDSIRVVRHEAKAKSLELSASVSPELPKEILVDGLRLREILLNLLHNAVKFTSKGSVKLSVEPGQGLIPGEGIRFAVEDTGMGILPTDREKVFEAFMQADFSDSRRFGGAGLGLAIVRRLVELMGGRIDFESVVDHGTKFFVELPLQPAESDPSSPTRPQPEPADNGDSRPLDHDLARRCPLRILVAEDSVVGQRLFKMLLTKLGYDPVLVANGREAVEAVQVQEFDLVLMDLQMPVLDGHAATREILDDGAGRPIPDVVALTASVQDEERERCLKAGMKGFLPKPLSRDRLIKELESAWKRRSHADTGPA